MDEGQNKLQSDYAERVIVVCTRIEANQTLQLFLAHCIELN